MNAFIIIALIGWPRTARFASGLLIALCLVAAHAEARVKANPEALKPPLQKLKPFSSRPRSSPQSQPPPQLKTALSGAAQTIIVMVNDVKASALLLEIARLYELDMVVGNRAFEARISMTEKFTSARAAINSIVTRTSLKASYKNGVMVIADPCTAELAPGFAKNALNPFSSTRLSLSFQQVDIATMLSLLQLAAARDIHANNNTSDNANTNAIKNEHENNASFNVFSGNGLLPVGAQLQNQSARQAYEAIASATGTGLMATTGEEYLVSQLVAQKKGCKTISAAITEAMELVLSNPGAPCQRLLIYPATTNIDCQPLESYKFSDISIRGYLKKGETMVTLAETRDQLSWPIRKSDLLGENFAQVEAINEQGLVVKELYINRYGYPFDRKFLLSFDGKQTAIAD